jgi:immune inhibitor A
VGRPAQGRDRPRVQGQGVGDLGGSWRFISDTGNAWYDAQVAAGKTPAEIDEYLAQFDVWDRYDWDHDGDFDEPDGYIDHFQAVHAGQGEDAGGGAQGADAIWSHRWYVNGGDYGLTGPVVGGQDNFMGGSRIGQSKYWFGDYTTEPENGGSASSRTSSATTSACPTTTTPRAARTAPPSGP